MGFRGDVDPGEDGEARSPSRGCSCSRRSSRWRSCRAPPARSRGASGVGIDDEPRRRPRRPRLAERRAHEGRASRCSRTRSRAGTDGECRGPPLGAVRRERAGRAAEADRAPSSSPRSHGRPSSGCAVIVRASTAGTIEQGDARDNVAFVRLTIPRGAIRRAGSTGADLSRNSYHSAGHHALNARRAGAGTGLAECHRYIVLVRKWESERRKDHRKTGSREGRRRNGWKAGSFRLSVFLFNPLP